MQMTGWDSLPEEGLIALSGQLESAERYSELEQVLRRLVSMRPASIEHGARLGWALLALNRPAEAAAVFAGITGSTPAEKSALACGAGISAYRTGEIKAAVHLLATASKGGMAAADMPLIKAANEAGLFDVALEVTTRLAAQAPFARDIVVLHARQLAYAGNFRAAADAILQLFSRKTADSETLELLAQTLVAAGDYRGASNVLAQLLRVDFERDEMQALWAHVLKEGFSSGEAGAELGRLIAADPQHCAALFQLARVRERDGDLADAARLIGQCASLLPESPLVDGLRGRLLLLCGNADGAVKLLQGVWRKMAAVVEAREKPRTPISPPPESSEPLTPTLYIPVEISSRELLSRLLLGLFAARAGFTVVMMGHTTLRQAEGLPRGFVLNKSLHALDDTLIAQTRRKSHVLCVIEEESFGWTGEVPALTRAMDPGLLPTCAAFFAPSRHYFEKVSAAYPDARLICAGNPRTDFLDPRLIGLAADEAEKVRQAQGPSILVCTNFGAWNSRVHHYGTVCTTASRVSGARPSSERGRWLQDLYQDAAEVECRDTVMVRTALPELVRAFPEHKIILRPHPSENPETWERLLAGMENVIVSGVESLHVQMFASDVMIHVPGCGTGVEARLAGRPAVCLSPQQDFVYPTLGISGRLSPSTHNIPSFLGLVKDAIAGKTAGAMTPEQADLLSAHVERPRDLVSAEIANHLVKLFKEMAGLDPKDRDLPRAEIAGLREPILAAKARADAAMFGNVGLRAKRFTVDKNKIETQIAALTSRLGMTERFAIDLLGEGVLTIRAGLQG